MIFLVLAFWGAWNIDMARQSIKIAFLTVTGSLWKLRGHVEKNFLVSRALGGESRQVLIYLPPGYEEPVNANRRYPVLYMLHGFPDPGDGWARFGLAPQLIDEAIVEHRLPPMLIAFPDAHGRLGKFGDGEYLDAPAGKGQPGTRLASFIVQDVPPWVDAHYRTLPLPSARLLVGSSTGAYGAVNLGLQHPQVFATLLALSGYYEVDRKHFGGVLWDANPDPAQLARESPLSFVGKVSSPLSRWKNTFVYLGDGQKDYQDVQEQTERMDAALARAGITHAHHRIYGHHSWDLWRAMLMDGLETVAPRIPDAAPAPATTPAASP